jgi:hypothetical protein
MFLFFDIALAISVLLEIKVNLKGRTFYVLRLKIYKGILYYVKRVGLSKF